MKLKNIILSNNNTLDFVKFYSALSLVHAVGLAKLIQNSKISKTIIILSKNEAEEIFNSYSKNVVSLVKDIYNENLLSEFIIHVRNILLSI